MTLHRRFGGNDGGWSLWHTKEIGVITRPREFGFDFLMVVWWWRTYLQLGMTKNGNNARVSLYVGIGDLDLAFLGFWPKWPRGARLGSMVSTVGQDDVGRSKKMLQGGGNGRKACRLRRKEAWDKKKGRKREWERKERREKESGAKWFWFWNLEFIAC